MPSTKSVFMAAAIAFSGTVSAHMLMATPKPFEFGDTSTANGPLKPDGSDFPCKSGNAKFNVQGSSNTMSQGSTQKLSFTGGATHGGGSCQVSLTADLVPTKNSVFKVIHSIEGGCPARNAAGNIGENAGAADPDTYQFTIPKDLAAGDYTLAWTWFNNLGNREMYMNCAPITVTGGGGGSGNGTVKRDEDSLIGGTSLNKRAAGSLSSLSGLPDMFVANAGTGCETAPGSGNLKFPNPGPSVEVLASGALKDPVGGSKCGGSTGSGSSQSPSGPSSSVSGSTATSEAAPPSNTGGVFVPVSSAASGAASSPSPMPSAASTVASSPPVAAPSSGSSAPVNGSGSGGSQSGGSGSGGSQSGACTAEGSFNCVGGTSFQQCASGAWSVVQPMAAGTKCTPGQTQTLNIAAGKRSFRFSRGHAHRRHNSYLDTY